MKDTLLGSDHVSTMDELKALFRKNDFSTARYYNDEELSDEQTEKINEIGKVFKKQWDELASQKGLKSGADNYSDDNPLMRMRDNMAQLVGEGVYKLVDEHPEKVNEILGSYQDVLCNPEKADEMFGKSIDTLMEVVDFEKIAKVIQGIPSEEDFRSIPNNHRAQDFYRKWNHTRAKASMQSLEDVPEDVPDHGYSVEEQAIYNIISNAFWSSLTNEDKQLLRYSMEKMTQQEIASKLGYKTHSAVTKRLTKIRAKFYKV